MRGNGIIGGPGIGITPFAHTIRGKVKIVSILGISARFSKPGES